MAGEGARAGEKIPSAGLSAEDQPGPTVARKSPAVDDQPVGPGAAPREWPAIRRRVA